MDTSEISYRVADFLKQHAPFHAADMRELVEMTARGRVRFYEPNEFILWQGEPHRLHVFVIQQGTVSLWEETADGAQLRDVRGAGDMLGIERYAGAAACVHTARSDTDVVLYAFPAEDFEASVLKYPQAAQYVAAEGRSTPDYQSLSDPQAIDRAFLNDLAARTPLVTCRPTDALADVAARLLASRADAVAVVDEQGRATGVVTTATIARWVAAGGGDADASLAEATAAIDLPPTIAPQASLTDGVLEMGAAGVETLAVTADGTSAGRLQTLVTAGDLAPAFGEHPVTLLAEITVAAGTREMREINQRARAFVLSQLRPSSVAWLARFVHLTDRAIATRILRLAGADEAATCWCFAGSSGRGEALTKLAPFPLAIVARDGDEEAAGQAQRRLLEALLECDYLPRDMSTFDAGFYVARVDEWKSRYRQWIQDPILSKMYRGRTLFDLRPIFGRLSLWEAIDADARNAVDVDFIRILANDCLATLPPLTFFQDAVIDRGGEHVSTFHLEESALRPLVDVGRVLGIATGAFLGRSTLDRFAAARARLPEHQALFREAAEAMRMVLAQQARVGIAHGTDGHDLPPALLSSYDRRALKSGFRTILRLLEFTNDPAWLDRL